jgi:hypothetical protein
MIRDTVNRTSIACMRNHNLTAATGGGGGGGGGVISDILGIAELIQL